LDSVATGTSAMVLVQNHRNSKAFQLTNAVNEKEDFNTIIAPGLKAFETHNIFSIHYFVVLAIAQFFGLFPVVNIFAKQSSNIHFKWLSFRMIHSTLWMASGAVFFYLELRRTLRDNELNAKNISKF